MFDDITTPEYLALVGLAFVVGFLTVWLMLAALD